MSSHDWKTIEQEIINGASIASVLGKHGVRYSVFWTEVQKGTLSITLRTSNADKGQSNKKIIDGIPNDVLLQLYRDNNSVAATIKQLGLTMSSSVMRLIKKRLCDCGVELKRKHPSVPGNDVVFRNYSKEDLILAASKSYSFSGMCRNVGVSPCTFNIKRIRDICGKLGIILADKKEDGICIKYTIETFFVENSTVARSSARLIAKRLGFYTGYCAECNCGELYNGKKLVLELDHINGIPSDNRKENLRWLCPNCHSQTDTYRRRRKR
jgi:hypothetical protein